MGVFQRVLSVLSSVRLIPLVLTMLNPKNAVAKTYSRSQQSFSRLRLTAGDARYYCQAFADCSNWKDRTMDSV
jgi:hypothetical protein